MGDTIQEPIPWWSYTGRLPGAGPDRRSRLPPPPHEADVQSSDPFRFQERSHSQGPGPRSSQPETHVPTSSSESKPLVAVIFSKDRPLQLDAALASLLLRCKDPERMDVNVLYATSSAYQEGLYKQLSLEYPGINFCRQQQFRQDVLDLVGKAAFVAFVVDDALFVREFSVQTVIEELEASDGAIGFSLRLGRNTTYCYPVDAQQELPEFATARPGVLAFHWPGASHDFGYPFDLSSSVYRTADIEPLLRRIRFTTPNLMEGRLAAGAASSGARRPVL